MAIPKTILLGPDNCWRIGERLKQIREELEIKQTEMAESTAMPQSAVSALESGRRLPQINTLINYADSLGFDLVLVNRRRQ
jgi:transcriptional regulator with XRE-family HTH domain